jgi:hypothetical protein
MARVTPAEVKLILPDSELTDAVITAFITSANNLVTEVLTDYLSETMLTEVEKWLTAHMITSTVERMATREGAGGAEIFYTGKYGQNLTSTPFGQMVLSLDPSGRMAALGGKTVSMIAIPNFD